MVCCHPFFEGDIVSKDVEEKINTWLEDVVIGLQLCPFALKPIREARHRIFVSQADDAATALEAIQSECQRLDSVDLYSVSFVYIDRRWS